MLLRICTFVVKHSIYGLLAGVFLLPITYDFSQGNIEELKVITDESSYNKGQTVKITIQNQSDKNTYIWTGPCSLILEWHNGLEWEASPTSWSGCPLCGHAREIPHPIFLRPGDTEKIEWDQVVTWCENGALKKKTALGRLRFIFRYTEDENKCRFSFNQLQCWLKYRYKKWNSAFSNEFNIKNNRTPQ